MIWAAFITLTPHERQGVWYHRSLHCLFNSLYRRTTEKLQCSMLLVDCHPLQWRHNETMASQFVSVSIICSPVCSDADQRQHQSSASLAFVRGIHRGPVNSPHKWPVTRKMFPFDDVIMVSMSWRHHVSLLWSVSPTYLTTLYSFCTLSSAADWRLRKRPQNFRSLYLSRCNNLPPLSCCCRCSSYSRSWCSLRHSHSCQFTLSWAWPGSSCDPRTPYDAPCGCSILLGKIVFLDFRP